MKKIFLFFAVFLLAITPVFAMTYQEDANSTSYIGNWINVTNAYDGDWSNYALGFYDTYGTYIYLNYTKPSKATNKSLWQVKDHNSTENLSIPQECFNEILQLRIQRITITGFSQISWNCYDGSSWKDLRISPIQEGYEIARVYEEAMFWDIEEEPTDCDYYVGDSEFNLPQITTEKSYDDGTTHKMYLACLYDLNGNAGYEGMISTQNCRESVQTFNPDTEGDYIYNLAIAYRERKWNQTSHQWETIAEGTDNSFLYNFNVCDIPNDDEGWNNFISWIQNLLCNWFGWFC